MAITNALAIALTMMGHPQLAVHVLGGRIRNAFSLAHGLSTPDAAEAAVGGRALGDSGVT